MILSKGNIDPFKDQQVPPPAEPVEVEERSEEKEVDLSVVAEKLQAIATKIALLENKEGVARLHDGVLSVIRMVQESEVKARQKEDRLSQMVASMLESQRKDRELIMQLIQKPGVDHSEYLKVISDGMGKREEAAQWVHKVKYSTSGYIEEIISNKKTT